MNSVPFSRRRLKSAFVWLHRWLGLVSGIVVFIVAITGCLHVFEEEWRELFQRKYFYVTPTNGGVRHSLEEIGVAARRAFPKEPFTQLRFRERADAAVIYTTRSGRAISMNPYTLEVIGSRNMKHDFFEWILKMHRELRMGKTGKEIVRWNVLIFFLLCISGLIIWWPKQRRFLRRAITIKWKTRNWKRLNWDLHSVLGFWSLLVLLIISLTGLFWVFDWAKGTVRLITQSPVVKEKKAQSQPNGSKKTLSLEQAYAIARDSFPAGTQVFINSNARDSLAPLRVIFRYPSLLVRNQHTVFLDQYSGRVIRKEEYTNYTGYDKVARANYDLHTGNLPYIGIGSKIIWFLASLFAASLPVTGVLMWIGKNKKKSYRLPASPAMPFSL